MYFASKKKILNIKFQYYSELTCNVQPFLFFFFEIKREFSSSKSCKKTLSWPNLTFKIVSIKNI